MAGGARPRKSSRRRARAGSAVIPLSPGSSRGRHLLGRSRTGTRVGDRLELTRLAPSGRSILLGLTILVLACGSYALARGTSAFAVEVVAVEGPPAHVGAQVTEALASARGSSLLALDLGGLEAVVEAIPSVAAVRFDRAFPHTLRVIVVPERPVAVLRQGGQSWLVSASGRVLAPLERGARPRLPRLWLKSGFVLEAGERVNGPLREVVRTVAPLVRAPLPARVATVRHGDTELTLVLRSGNEIRLGNPSDRALKLELARRILPTVGEDERYVDVSVPERPVVGTSPNPQVEPEPQTSILP